MGIIVFLVIMARDQLITEEEPVSGHWVGGSAVFILDQSA
jgi:hypothetical protein